MATSKKLAPETATIRVQRIAQYATPGSEVGIPWDLWEAYIGEMSEHYRKQQMFCVSSAAEVQKHRSLAAPVDGPVRSADFVSTGRSGVTYVYPVIAK